jgi:hypothetical protein
VKKPVEDIVVNDRTGIQSISLILLGG